MTDVWHALTRLERDALNAVHPHRNANPTGDAPMHIASLTDGLIHDLEAAGVAVTDDMRKIIANRHGIVSVLSHTADYMNLIQNSAWAPLFERYAGLDPSVVATAVHVVDVIAADGARMLAGPQPPAEGAPAQ